MLNMFVMGLLLESLRFAQFVQWTALWMQVLPAQWCHTQYVCGGQ
jgi:hypothetical protein